MKRKRTNGSDTKWSGVVVSLSPPILLPPGGRHGRTEWESNGKRDDHIRHPIFYRPSHIHPFPSRSSRAPPSPSAARTRWMGEERVVRRTWKGHGCDGSFLVSLH